MVAALGFVTFLLGLFFLVRFGIIKSWFVLKTLPGLLSARMIYAAFPLGLFFLFLAIIPLMPGWESRDWNRFTGWDLIMLMPLLSFAFMIWPPSWIKPAWLRWLEQEYGYCLDILIEEAQKMNRWDWEDRVRTHAGMQAWIDDVFEQRKEEVEQRWVAVCYTLLQEQAEAEGQKYTMLGDKLKCYVPEHRREQEEARIRQELEEYERRQGHKRK